MKMKKWVLFAVLPLVIIIIMVAAGAIKEKSMAVDDNDFVSVYYTGTFENGTVFDTNEGQELPYTFQVGAGQVIPGFEKGVIGMKLGEERNVTIQPEDAYGPVEGHPLQNEVLVFQIRLVDIEKFD